MADSKVFPLGPRNLLENSFVYAEFLRIINHVNLRSFQTRIEDGNLNLYVQPPYKNMMGPYLYIDDTDKDKHLTYLKHGTIEGDSVILATYDSGVLAEDNPLDLNLEALKAVQERQVESRDEFMQERHGARSRTQEHDFSSGANVYFDFNFFCLCGAAGGAVLLVGALIANPVVLIVGACILGAGVVGMGYNHFFSAASHDTNESLGHTNLAIR